MRPLTLSNSLSNHPASNPANNPTDANLPIGVFDSGVGGLTVLAALRSALPAEDFLYLGDTARLPYGTKSPATVRRYAQMAASALVARGVKALVVACNTASAFALHDLAQHFAPLPVYGVVEPGAQAAIESAALGNAKPNAINGGILVLATESTIKGGAYQRALLTRAPDIPVYGRACPLWVTLAEQGPQSKQFTHLVLEHDLAGLDAKGAYTLLLGCTHFPVFRELLENIVGDDVVIVDSAQTTASAVATQLQQLQLLRSVDGPVGDCRYMATDNAQRFMQVGRHFLHDAPNKVEIIDL